jgi:hypothetical protein
MTQIKRVSVMVGVVLLLMSASRAYALGVPGAWGNSYGENSCFTIQGGSIVNTKCLSAGIQWFMQLPVNAGGHTVTVNGTNNSHSLVCSLESLTQTGAYYQLQQVFFPVGISSQNLAVSVPGDGALWLDCHIYANDSINSANYGQ